jgi:hypothetical protein
VDHYQSQIDELKKGGVSEMSKIDSSTRSRADELRELLAKPKKGDINEYMDFGSIRKRPRHKKGHGVSIEEAKFPNIFSWLLKKVERNSQRSDVRSNMELDTSSVTVFNHNS